MPTNNPIGTHTGPWTFEQALTHMKAGGRVRRALWPDVGYMDIDDGAVKLHLHANDPGRRIALDGAALLACDYEEAPLGSAI